MKEGSSAVECYRHFLDLLGRMEDLCLSYAELHGGDVTMFQMEALVDLVMDTKTPLGLDLRREYHALAQSLAKNPEMGREFFMICERTKYTK